MGFFSKIFGGLFGEGKTEAETCGSCCPAPSGDAQDKLRQFVEYVCKELVDDRDAVKVTLEDAESGTVVRIDCRKEDKGKIVGKHGRTIMAMRSLLNGAAGRMQKRISVELVD